MTLVLAVRCRDGLLLASDSQGTQLASGQPVKIRSKKIHAQWSNVAWGAAGEIGMAQRVQAELRKKHGSPDAFKTKSFGDLRREIVEVVTKASVLLREQYQVGDKDQVPSAHFIFVGVCHNQPFILEVDTRSVDTDYSDVGHLGIGSGDVFAFHAMAGVSGLDLPNRPLHQAKLIVYRVVSDAISTAAFGLGPPVQMIEIAREDSGWALRDINEGTMQTIADNVTLLRGFEADCLDQFDLPSQTTTNSNVPAG